jgi:hypothetical protein
MTTLDVDVADVSAPQGTKSPDAKAALIYLRESGASPICIVECDGVCKFTMGKVDKNAVETWWIAEVDARGVVTLARKIAGNAPDVVKAEAALHEAAREKRASLSSGCGDTSLSCFRTAASRRPGRRCSRRYSAASKAVLHRS